MESIHENSQPNPRLLNNRYRIEQKLGEGGFAETYVGYDTRNGRRCVLKMLTWKEIPDWKVIELFEREARVLSQMKHPRIPEFLEFFTYTGEADTKIVLVQEYIEGKNLSELIREGKHYTEDEVIRLGIEAAKILEYLHGFSPAIIHRDIKPSNLLLSADGELHLIDFGAVRDKVLHHQKTEAGGFTVVGTYGFMPFEQFQGQAVPASDIYSLGMTLIHLLSHREPHEMEMAGSEVNFTPYVNVSPGFTSVLKKMVAHRVEDRYADATEVRSDLIALLHGEEPQSVEKQKKSWRISSGTLVAIALVLFVVWFAMVRKPMQIPRQTVPQAPIQALQQGPLVRGAIEFDGKPVTVFTNVQPSVWIRNEATGKLVSANFRYTDGKFEISGLPPGRYGIAIQFDSNQLNPLNFPGDLRDWQQFTVPVSGNAAITVEMQKLIHLVKPADNGRVLAKWNRCCEEGEPQHASDLQIRWDALGEKDVIYDYQISRLLCPYKFVESMASGSTDQTSINLQLPASKENEYYILQLTARKGGKHIGMLMTHGANGYGWDYRFRIR